jgi:hypothetical protein
MSHLSIRYLPPKLEKKICREAQRRHTTKTAVVLEALEKAFQKHSYQRNQDFRSFFGKMTQAEFKNFQKATQVFDRIDPELWR